ncbi:MAG: DNA/RNA nuclease SfsA [Desulfitobacterium sp.]|nr:DNA/RNA nuclease SfsA [Desulfitobacterium sp.]
MFYTNIKEGRFISRPNRFIAHVEIEGQEEICHVKNTGRCKELLLPGAKVFLQESANPNRKTKFDLIGVYKGDLLVNIDSQVPNKVFREWLEKTNYIPHLTTIRPEYKYKNSRFDFYLEGDGKKILVEVKGVTLEEEGVALFPDAPTERGVRHIYELCEGREDGFEAYIVFIIQMKGIKYFIPNVKTHPAFGEALKYATARGVNVLALDCLVTEDSITADQFIEVRV